MMEGKTIDRIAALDGLRGVAILLVVLSHAFPEQFAMGGPVGVTLFFVLSGFLITRILITREQSLKTFYLRRAKRLFPALIVFLVVMGALFGWEIIWAPLLYVGNYAQIAGSVDWPVTHTWSLAVEEHFYLIWPAACLFIPKARNPRVLAMVVAVSLSLRFLVPAQWAYAGTFTNAYALVLGCIIALTVNSWQPKRIVGNVSLFGLVAVSLIWPLTNSEFADVAKWLSPVAAGFAVLAVWTAATQPIPTLEPRWLRHVGQISYGWYLWHAPMLLWVHYVVEIPALSLVAVGASYLVALLSWRFIEQPVLNWTSTRERLRASSSRLSPT